MHVPLWAWVAVVAVIGAALALDLLVFHRRPHEVSMREAALTSGLWVALGLGFAGVVALAWGGHAAGSYLAGYLIEKSLSVDNIFVFSLLLTAFAVPAVNHHRVLFWGVIGALVFRGAFIAAGAALLETFHWALYAFGAFLVVTGVKLARSKHEAVAPERNPLLRAVRRFVPMTSDHRGSRFFVKEAGRRLATPMVAVLVAVETTDLFFAVDSIPAVFAVTGEPFLVFTSNAFAILGLRSLYFLLAGMLNRFVYLKYGLAAILSFVGAKLLLAEVLPIPIAVSLFMITVLLGASVLASLRVTRGLGAVEVAVAPEAQVR